MRKAIPESTLNRVLQSGGDKSFLVIGHLVLCKSLN